MQSLNPSDKTAQKAQQVGKQLGEARQKLAQQGQTHGQEGEKMGQGNSGQAPGGQVQPGTAGAPMDAPPKLDTPGVRGPYRSPAMNRNLRDY